MSARWSVHEVELYYFHLKNAKCRKQCTEVPRLCGCRLMKQSKLQELKLEEARDKAESLYRNLE